MAGGSTSGSEYICYRGKAGRSMQDDDDKQQKEPTTTRLDEANLVGNVERVVVGRQADVRLLLAVGAVYCT